MLETPTFGWVMPTRPRGFPDEIMADPKRAGRALLEAAERFIELAYPALQTVWITDHLQFGKELVLESMTALTYMAGRHERLKFGHLVLCQAFRNPALTAKMAANLQLMTGGRYILGLGAGWHEEEFRGYGYPYPAPGVRVAQLEEAVQIIRAMWNQSPASFEGKYYRIENAECRPQPDPPIPLLLGGGGEKKTLRVVARYADWWNFNFSNAEEYAHKQRVLEGHCREVGRDPGDIEHTYDTSISLVDDPSAVERRDSHGIVGTPDMVARGLQEFIDLGVRHFQLRFVDFPSTRGLELFVEKVLPRLGA